MRALFYPFLRRHCLLDSIEAGRCTEKSVKMDGKRDRDTEDRREGKKVRREDGKSRPEGLVEESDSRQDSHKGLGKDEPVGPVCVLLRQSWNWDLGPPKPRHGESFAALEQAYLRAVYDDDWEHRLRRKEDKDWFPIHKQYEDYCAIADADPSFHGYKLEYDEFRCQRAIREDEFGPNDSLDSIWGDAMDSPLPPKIQMREWRLCANRFLEVQRIQKKKLESGSLTDQEDHVVSLADKDEEKWVPVEDNSGGGSDKDHTKRHS